MFKNQFPEDCAFPQKTNQPTFAGECRIWRAIDFLLFKEQINGVKLSARQFLLYFGDNTVV